MERTGYASRSKFLVADVGAVDVQPEALALDGALVEKVDLEVEEHAAIWTALDHAGTLAARVAARKPVRS